MVGLQEEDILDLLEQCELDDEKLTGKSARQRGPKVGENERGGEEKPREREGREKNRMVALPQETREGVQGEESQKEK